MKNLKKVLALVLAFACAFTMFAGAAFTDQADISQTEAVDMLTALGVIEGFPDGSFAPDATITRAQAAKMIYTIWNGGNADASAFEGKSVFTDVYSGHWAEGYINFCYTNGIINGLSATKFGPDDSVTGTQLAKMLLICMGYQADKSGLEGTGYSQRTNALATQNGLYVDVATSVSQAMPRQYAAQLMYNALKADTVEWSTDSNAYSKVTSIGYNMIPNGDGTYRMEQTTVYETMGKKCMDLNTVETILSSVSKEDNRDTYTLNDGAFTRVAKDYSNLIGQKVNVLQKGTDKTKVYGVYAHEDSTVVATGFVGQLETVSGGEKIKLDGTEYKLSATDATTSVYEINDDINAKSVPAGTTNLKAMADSVTTVNYREVNEAAAEIKLIDNTGDGKIDLAIQTPVKVGQVNAVTKTSVTINGAGTFKFADDTIYDDIAKNDYVRVIADSYVSEGGNHVEKLDVTNAKVDGTRTGEARVDGTWYKLAQDNTGAYISVDTNTTYDLVIVGNTILFADETEGSIANVAFISAVNDTADGIVGDTNKTTKVRMYFNDGTNAEVSVSRVAGTKLTAELPQSYAGEMVTYSKLSDDTYDIELVSDTNLAGTDDFVAQGEKSPVSGSTNGAYYDSKIYGTSIADDAVIFVKTGNGLSNPANAETKVLTGAQVKNWAKTIDTTSTFTSDFLMAKTNGIEYVQAATLVTAADISVPGAKDMLYAYATVNSYEGTLNGETKTAVEAWNGTDTVTLWADGNELDNVKAGNLFAYKVNGDFVEDIVVASHNAAVLGFDGVAEGELRVADFGNDDVADDAGKTYTLAEDCVILAVDDSANEGMEGAGVDSIIEAGYKTNVTNPTELDRIPNVRYILGSDIGDNDNANKIVAIVIDAESNELA